MSTTLTAPVTAVEAPTTVADVLRGARALVEAGWTQGQYCRTLPDGTQGVCAEGAMNRAWPTDVLDESRQAWIKAWDVLAEAVREVGGGSIVGWNDTPGRTQDEVLAMFDRAIQIAAQS